MAESPEQMLQLVPFDEDRDGQQLFVTPDAVMDAQQLSITPKKQENKSMVVDCPLPVDLPDGWTAQARQRLSGKLKGKIDWYYYHKTSKVMARSREEMRRYDANGSIKNNVPKRVNKSTSVTHEKESNIPVKMLKRTENKLDFEDIHVSGKETKSAVKSEKGCKSEKVPMKSESKLGFDGAYGKVKVNWVLCDAKENIWEAIIDGKVVAVDVKLKWEHELPAADGVASKGTIKKRKYRRREKGECSNGADKSPNPALV